VVRLGLLDYGGETHVLARVVRRREGAHALEQHERDGEGGEGGDAAKGAIGRHGDLLERARRGGARSQRTTELVGMAATCSSGLACSVEAREATAWNTVSVMAAADSAAAARANSLDMSDSSVKCIG